MTITAKVQNTTLSSISRSKLSAVGQRLDNKQEAWPEYGPVLTVEVSAIPSYEGGRLTIAQTNMPDGGAQVGGVYAFTLTFSTMPHQIDHTSR